MAIISLRVNVKNTISSDLTLNLIPLLIQNLSKILKVGVVGARGIRGGDIPPCPPLATARGKLSPREEFPLDPL